MLKNLPASLLKASLKVLEETPAVVETEVIEDSEQMIEDAISAMNVPSEDEPEAQLSGDKEEVVINPEYKTARTRWSY